MRSHDSLLPLVAVMVLACGSSGSSPTGSAAGNAGGAAATSTGGATAAGGSAAGGATAAGGNPAGGATSTGGAGGAAGTSGTDCPKAVPSGLCSTPKLTCEYSGSDGCPVIVDCEATLGPPSWNGIAPTDGAACATNGKVCKYTESHGDTPPASILATCMGTTWSVKNGGISAVPCTPGGACAGIAFCFMGDITCTCGPGMTLVCM